MLLFVLILFAAIGFLFCFFGWRLWKKQQITLIHSYHYTKVSEEDKKPYTALMGKGLVVMGLGMFASGVANYLSGGMDFMFFFIVGFLVGLAIIFTAQIKYNHGLF